VSSNLTSSAKSIGITRLHDTTTACLLKPSAGWLFLWPHSLLSGIGVLGGVPAGIKPRLIVGIEGRSLVYFIPIWV